MVASVLVARSRFDDQRRALDPRMFGRVRVRYWWSRKGAHCRAILGDHAHVDLDARVTAALIAGIAGFLGAVIAATISIWNRRKTDQQQRELQAHRARLDQLDRVHSRRVEQIEILYAGIEAATHVLLSDELPDPNEALLGAEELQTARRLHAGARIYLDDDVDRLCLDLLEELQRAWSARWEHHEWGFAPKIPEEVLAELRRYPEVASAGQALRDRLRVQLRAALNGKRHTSDQ